MLQSSEDLAIPKVFFRSELITRSANDLKTILPEGVDQFIELGVISDRDASQSGDIDNKDWLSFQILQAQLLPL